MAIFACILCIPALATHIRGRNFAASVLMFSIIVPNVFNIIDPLIWPTEFPENWWSGVGLCDIEVKLELAFSGARVGAIACIFRQLAIILNTDRTVLTPSLGQRRRKWVFEVGLCVVVPAYLMIAHYFVQPFRYYVFSVEGCTPSFDNSWVSIVLIFLWPLLLCIIATIYGALAFYRLVKYRRQFAVILSSSQSSMSRSRFIRLFVLSTTLILIYLPLVIFTFRQNTSFPRHSYSWSRVHPKGWSETIVKVAGQANGGFDRWTQIGTGFLVFPFFGLGQDAKALYRSWLLKLDVDRFTKPRTNSSGQTLLTNKKGGSGCGAERQSGLKSQHSPSTDISITLHEDEPLEKISVSDVPNVYHDIHPWQNTSPATEEAIREPFKEIQFTSNPRETAAFKIWAEEPALPITSNESIKVKNEFELSEHMTDRRV